MIDADMPVRHMRDVYPDDGEGVDDDIWIARCGAEGWVIYTKDRSIIRNHREAIVAAAAIVFAIPDAQMSGADQAARFIDNRHRIARRAAKGGPAGWILQSRAIEKRL